MTDEELWYKFEQFCVDNLSYQPARNEDPERTWFKWFCKGYSLGEKTERENAVKLAREITE